MLRRDYLKAIKESGDTTPGLSKMRISELKDLYNKLNIKSEAAQDVQDVQDPYHVDELSSEDEGEDEEAQVAPEPAAPDPVAPEPVKYTSPIAREESSDEEPEIKEQHIRTEPLVRRQRLEPEPQVKKVDVKVFEKELTTRLNQHKKNVRSLIKEYPTPLDETDKDDLRDDYNELRSNVEADIDTLNRFIGNMSLELSPKFVDRMNVLLDRELKRVKKVIN